MLPRPAHGSRPRPPRRCLTAFLFCSLLIVGSASAESPIRNIDVAQTGDGFVADVVMYAPVPVRVAWDVLTDFDHMHKWVPNVRQTKIVERDADGLIIEQRGVAKFGVLSFPYTSVRKMQLDPLRTIRSTQIEGSMRRLASLMTLEPDGNGTRLVYHLELEPTGIAAAVLSKDFVSHEIGEQFSEVVGEMSRRVRHADDATGTEAK